MSRVTHDSVGCDGEIILKSSPFLEFSTEELQEWDILVADERCNITLNFPALEVSSLFYWKKVCNFKIIFAVPHFSGTYIPDLLLYFLFVTLFKKYNSFEIYLNKLLQNLRKWRQFQKYWQPNFQIPYLDEKVDIDWDFPSNWLLIEEEL